MNESIRTIDLTDFLSGFLPLDSKNEIHGWWQRTKMKEIKLVLNERKKGDGSDG